MKARPRLFLALALLATSVLTGCGGGDALLRAKALDHFSRGEFAEAERETAQPKVVEERQNRLLTMLELGAIAHYQGHYEKSNLFLYRAKKIADELYTTSIREQIATGIFNDNSASYVGMEYELSLLHYYVTTNFLMISQSEKLSGWTSPELRDGKDIVFAAETRAERNLSGNERVQALGQARSSLLAWNAYLREVRERNRGQPYYKDDLLNKVLAAYVHRLIGSSGDANTAHVLLKDAEKLLVRAYSAYPSFNAKAPEYVDNFDKFEALGEESVKNRFISPTPYYQAFETQLAAETKGPGNVFFLLEHGLAPKRQEKSYVIGLSTLFREIKDPQLRRSVEELGAHVLLQYAPMFGLTFFGATVVGAATGKGADGESPKYLSEAVDSAIGFEFKLPKMETDPILENYSIHYVREGDDQEIVAPVALVSPIADIARLDVDRRAAALVFKTGVRVGLKYLAALVPAIMTYRQVNGPDFVKLLAASAVWMAGKKIVDATEEADIRAWSYLPKWIGVAETLLPPGQYRVSAERLGDKQVFPMGTVKLAKPETKLVLKARILGDGKIAKSSAPNIME